MKGLRFDLLVMQLQELLRAEEALALQASGQSRYVELLVGEDLLQASHLVQGGERGELGRQG